MKPYEKLMRGYEDFFPVKNKKHEDYSMGKVRNTPSVQALFFNKLDSVIRSEDEEFFIRGEKETVLEEFKEDNSVRYYFNSLGYRSDEFTKFHNGEHILFSGCSETEGVGGNLDSNWAHIAYTELVKNNKLSGFFNLSRAGWGHETIIMNIMQYIKEYGKPDKIYMLFPNIARKYEWEQSYEDEEWYTHKLKTPYWSPHPDEIYLFGEIRKKQTLEEHRSDIIRFTILLKMFEEYCSSNNIKLQWSSWDQEDAENYKNLNVFKNFVLLPDKAEIILESRYLSVDSETEKTKFRKRDWHHGYLYHYLWAQRFLSVVDTK